MGRGKKKNREKEDKRRRRAWSLVQIAVGPWLKKKFNFSFEDFDPSVIEGPVLLAVNHACAYDPLFAGVAFRKKPLTFIASEHTIRMRPWGPLIDRYFSIIPHQKGGRGSRTALIAMKRIKRGESVFLAVEGEQTWDGRPMPVMPYTGKLAKGSKATLVTYMIEGAYLSAPRWSLSTRRGRVYGHTVNVYSHEVLQSMSDEEVEEAIAKDLAFDTWEWQKTRLEGPVRYKCEKGGFADGLERSVFTCPECGAMGTLRSQGDSISCSCGFKARMLDTGFFEEGAPFETVADWEEYDRESLDKILGGTVGTVPAVPLLQKNGSAGTVPNVPFCDDDIVLRRILDGHRDEEAARGSLTLTREDGAFMLRIGDFSFDLKKISNMTMVLANRIVFSDENGYYELLSNKQHRTNLRKYVIARDLLMKG